MKTPFNSLILASALCALAPNFPLPALAAVEKIDNSTTIQNNNLPPASNRAHQEFGYLGILGGGNSAATREGDTTPTYGLTIGAKLTPAFGVGFFGSRYGQNSEGSLFGLPVGAATSTTVFAGQANFFLGGLHLGAEIGSATYSWSGHVSSLHTGTSTSSLIYGPTVGYDLIFNHFVSLGGEGHYLITTANGGVDNIQVFAALKIWQ